MTLNTAGILAVFQAAARPSLLLPRIVVKDIRQLDLKKLRARGVTAVVLDKDNCLTKPRHDAVVQELQEAWPALVRAFGRRNVLIVSNSAGTRDDAGLLQAESVSRHLGVPLLLHAVKKPGCAKAVYQYFAPQQLEEGISHKGKGKQREMQQRGPVVDVSPIHSAGVLEKQSMHNMQGDARLSRPKILVIGDRVMTDVVLANRLNLLQHRTPFLRRLFTLFQKPSAQPAESVEGGIEAIPVLTTHIWEIEGSGSRLMRAIEGGTMRAVLRYHKRRTGHDPLSDWRECITHEAEPIQEAELAKSAAKAAHKRTVQQTLHRVLLLAASPITRLYTSLQERVQKRLETFLAEARQAQFGFRIPEGYGRVRTLRRLVEGTPAQIMRKGL